MAYVASVPVFVQSGETFRVITRPETNTITIRVGHLDVTFYLPEGADLDAYLDQLHAGTAPREVAS
jgi:hypothetical protein